jgi:excinuclease ABC subunit C
VKDERDFMLWLTEKRGKPVRMFTPKRGKKAGLIQLCQKNAQFILNELRAQKEASGDWITPSVLALQKDLKLEQPPIRIEAFDNSNIQGSDPVASMVVFENGKPKKSEYRKFRIKTVQGVDDFASMAEIIERRITRILKEGRDMPDLILVDGGKGQLNAGLSVLKKFEMNNQPIIGLAKRLEEIFLPGFSDPQMLPKTSASLHLLQRIRDEAHRFAITFHRSLRQKRSVHSILDDIPGIGEKRRVTLLKTFGSVKNIRSATVQEIAQVQGMNRKIAEQVVKALQSERI